MRSTSSASAACTRSPRRPAPSSSTSPSSAPRSTATPSSTGSLRSGSAIRNSLRRRRSRTSPPGHAGAEERREIALALRARRVELLGHELVVDGTLDVAQDADRRRVRRRVRQPAQGERGARLGMVRVVHEQLRLVRNVDHFDASISALAHTLLALLAEADRLAVLEVDPVRLVLADEVEGAVVVDVAVLEDLHEGAA